MSFSQAEQLSNMNKQLESQSEMMNSYSGSMSSVFDGLDRVLSRFKPNKFLSFLEDSSQSASESLNAYESLNDMDEFMDSLYGSMEEMSGGSAEMVSQLEELQSLLDVDVTDAEPSTLNLEGIDEPPEEVLNELQSEIDALSEKTNNFYTVLVEDGLEGELEPEMREFKEETMSWIGKLDDKMSDLFHRDEDFREFGRDRREQWEDMEDEVEDQSGKLSKLMDKIFSPETASIGALFSIGNLKGEVENEISSLYEVRKDFMEQLGKTREEWAGFFKEDVQMFKEVNEETEGMFSYREDYIQSLSEAINTDVADEEVLHKMTEYAMRYRHALEGMDLENWEFVRKSMAEWEEEGSEAIKRISDWVAYLDNEVELHVSAQDLMGVVEDYDNVVRSMTDNAEDYQKSMRGVAQATALANHAHLDGSQIMEGFKEVMMKGASADNDMVKQLVQAGMSPEKVRKQLQKGNYSKVMKEYVTNLGDKLKQFDGVMRYKFAEQIGLSGDQTDQLVNASGRIQDALDKLGEKGIKELNQKLKDGEDISSWLDYIEKEYNPENMGKGFVEKKINDILSSGPVTKVMELWNSMGMNAEILTAGVIMMNQGLQAFGTSLGSIFNKIAGNILSIGGLGNKLETVALKAMYAGGKLKGVLFNSLNLAKTGVVNLGSSMLSMASTAISGLVGALSTVVTSVWGFTTALLANPITWVVVGVVALGVALYQLAKHWDTVKEYAMMFGDYILDLPGKIKSGFNSLGTFLSSMFNSISDKVKGFINTAISGVNYLINGLNKIQFEAPDWVPGIGGKTFGVNIQKIPLLAGGGVVKEPTLVMAGERETEVVSPLSEMDKIRDNPAIGSDKSDSIDSTSSDNIKHTPDTITEVINDNQDIVDIIEWQTKKIVDVLKEISPGNNDSKRDKPKRKPNPVRNSLHNLSN